MTTVYVIGYPKSGTTWLARLLGDVLDSPVGSTHLPGNATAIATEGQGRQGGHYVRQGHPLPVTRKPKNHLELAYQLGDGRIVLMLRDPRDICVSGAYHWGRPLKPYIHCAGRGE